MDISFMLNLSVIMEYFFLFFLFFFFVWLKSSWPLVVETTTPTFTVRCVGVLQSTFSVKKVQNVLVLITEPLLEFTWWNVHVSLLINCISEGTSQPSHAVLKWAMWLDWILVEPNTDWIEVDLIMTLNSIVDLCFKAVKTIW